MDCEWQLNCYCTWVSTLRVEMLELPALGDTVLCESPRTSETNKISSSVAATPQIAFPRLCKRHSPVCNIFCMNIAFKTPSHSKFWFEIKPKKPIAVVTINPKSLNMAVVLSSSSLGYMHIANIYILFFPFFDKAPDRKCLGTRSGCVLRAI